MSERSFEELYDSFTTQCGSFGNGHDQFMIIGVPPEKLIPYLNDNADFDLICEGDHEVDHAHNLDVISFDAHGIRFDGCGDLLRNISNAFPQATCYWCDCWEDELSFECYKNGRNCVDDKLYTIEITAFEFADDLGTDDEPERYFCFECSLRDARTGAVMTLGGGMVYERDIKKLIEQHESEIANLSAYAPDLAAYGLYDNGFRERNLNDDKPLIRSALAELERTGYKGLGSLVAKDAAELLHYLRCEDYCRKRNISVADMTPDDYENIAEEEWQKHDDYER